MILVLDPQRDAERGNREARDVAGGEDVVVTGDAAVLVDHDPVVDLEPRCLGELRVGDDAEPGDDCIGLELQAGLGLDRRARRLGDQLAGAHVNALLAVVVGDGRREAGGEEAMADAVLGEEHRHADAVADQPRRELRADEAAADHDDVRPLAGELANVPVVVERAVPDDAVGTRESRAAWRRWRAAASPSRTPHRRRRSRCDLQGRARRSGAR